MILKNKIRIVCRLKGYETSTSLFGEGGELITVTRGGETRALIRIKLKELLEKGKSGGRERGRRRGGVRERWE